MSTVTDQDLKNKLLQDHKVQEVKKTNFPTEIIDLPSKGLVYAASNPLSSGKLEMKYMTAREEDILTSANLIKQGVVLDKLFQSLIVSPINYNDLVVGDKNAIMVAARVLGYGKEYATEINCPECDTLNKVSIDLSTVKDKELDQSKFPKGQNLFTFELPQSKRKVTFKILTHGDEQFIDQELKSNKKLSNSEVNRELSTRLKYIIQSVDGNSDRAFIRSFVDDELFAQDSRALRDYIKAISPDVDLSFPFTCKNCGHEASMAIPVDVGFFWPRA
jgi:transcription elongation factor Elf1